MLGIARRHPFDQKPQAIGTPPTCIKSPKQRVEVMKFSEFRRWLRTLGVTFEAGKGTHFKVTAPNGNKTTFADLGSKETPESTRKAIIERLGI